MAKVVFALQDPDPRSPSRRPAPDRRPEVVGGVGRAAVAEQLAPYVKHRTTGRPWVVLKAGRPADQPHPRRPTAPASGSPAPRAGPTPTLPGRSDAVIVGAGAVRADDPSLTVPTPAGLTPLRVVLGRGARGRQGPPALEARRPLSRCSTSGGYAGDVVQAMVEGGASVAGAFHRGAWSTATCSTWRRRCSGATTPRGLFAGPGAPPPSTTSGAASCARSAGSAPTCLVEPRPPVLVLARFRCRRAPKSGARKHRIQQGDRLMFTGIVEELGTVGSRSRLRPTACGSHRRRRRWTAPAGATPPPGQRVLLTIVALGPCRPGPSVVGGRRERGDPKAHQRGQPRPGDPVNLEAPVRLVDRLGGHLVRATSTPSGGSSTGARPAGACRHLLRYVIEKGSITVDGVQPDGGPVHSGRLHRRRHPHTARSPPSAPAVPATS